MTREGAKSVVGLLERMKRGKGIKGLDDKSSGIILFYYESRKRKLKTRLIYEDRCDERLKN